MITADNLSSAVGWGRLGTESGVLRYGAGPATQQNAVPFTEGMLVGYDGAVLVEGDEQAPRRVGNGTGTTGVRA